jgi:hypothetical protein
MEPRKRKEEPEIDMFGEGAAGFFCDSHAEVTSQ